MENKLFSSGCYWCHFNYFHLLSGNSGGIGRVMFPVVKNIAKSVFYAHFDSKTVMQWLYQCTTTITQDEFTAVITKPNCTEDLQL